MTLEERRALWEDLEVIENAISERFQRNPSLYYHSLPILSDLLKQNNNDYNSTQISENVIYNVKKIKRSRKQLIAQGHEIKLFVKDRDAIIKKLETMNVVPITQSNLSIKDFKDSVISEKSFSKESLKEKQSKYSIFPKTVDQDARQLLSLRAEDLSLNKLFSREEQYGEYFDFDAIYNEWINVIKNSDHTILDFLAMLEEKFIDKKEDTDSSNYSYLFEPLTDRKNKRYEVFIEKITKYLEKFLYKSYPLINKATVENELAHEFEKNYINNPITHKEPFKKLLCIVCGKNFANLSVFKNHLNGKNHQKNLINRRDFYYYEFKLKRFLNVLKDTFYHTRNFTERKLAFTLDERKEELQRITEIYNAPVYGKGEKENDIDDKSNDVNNKEEENKRNNTIPNGTFDMPIGPDGMPMPYWLYKLQGLDVKYTCEICGNKELQGRRAFEKHFREPMHIYHLKCLGITASAVFKGITSISEAQSLWKRVNSSVRMGSMNSYKSVKNDSIIKSDNNNAVKMDIEIEDEDGNVMTEQVYNDLKKQGLL